MAQPKLFRTCKAVWKAHKKHPELTLSILKSWGKGRPCFALLTKDGTQCLLTDGTVGIPDLPPES